MMVPAVITASKAGATVVACIGLAVNTSSVGGDRLWGFIYCSRLPLARKSLSLYMSLRHTEPKLLHAHI